MEISRSLRRAFASGLVAAIVLTIDHGAAAQDSLAAARDLYAAAAYGEALAMLNGLRSANRRVDESRAIDEYRAFCLLALGRAAEAEKAIEAVVTAAPAYHLPDADASPRVRSAFSEVRRRILPAIIERKYADAKAAFERRDFGVAQDGFRQVLTLLADADLGSAANQPPLSDLRTLAAGFGDLSTTPATPPRPLASQLPRPQPPPGPPPVLPQSAPRIYSQEDRNVVPPAAVRQSFSALAGVFALRPGVVEVIVDETGAVMTAMMIVPVNPIYDRVALATAKAWRYRPAMLDGVPVVYRKIVPIDAKPTR